MLTSSFPKVVSILLSGGVEDALHQGRADSYRDSRDPSQPKLLSESNGLVLPFPNLGMGESSGASWGISPMHHVTEPGLRSSTYLGLAAITTMVGGCFYFFSPAQSEQQNMMRAVLELRAVLWLLNAFYFLFIDDGLVGWQLLFAWRWQTLLGVCSLCAPKRK